MELEKNFIHKNEMLSTAYSQATVEDDYNLPDYKPDMIKLIDARGVVEVEETKAASQSVFVQGKLQFFVLYRGDSAERGINSLTGEIPFREKINMDGVEELDPVTVRADVADLAISVINSRKISLRGIVEFRAESAVVTDMAFPVAISPEGGCEVKTCRKQMLQLVDHKKDIVRIRQEISLPREKANGSEMIWHVMNLEGANTRLAGEGVEISGMAHLCVLYHGMDEQPFDWYETTIPVSGILPCQMCADVEHFRVKICHTRSAAEFREDADQEMRQIALELDLEVELSLWKEEEIEFVEDLYSLSQELQLTRATESMEQVLIQNYGKCKVSGEMKLDDLEEAIYLCAGQGRVRIRRTRIVEDGVEIQGEMSVSVLCLTADDDIPITCAREVFPFTQVLEAKGVDENSRVELEADMDHLQLSLADAHHADVRGEIQLNMMVFSREELPVIQSVIEAEPDEAALLASPGMVGYTVQKGDSLWKIARENHTTVEELRRINQLEDDILMPGQKLLIVKHVAPRTA